MLEQGIELSNMMNIWVLLTLLHLLMVEESLFLLQMTKKFLFGNLVFLW